MNGVWRLGPTDVALAQRTFVMMAAAFDEPRDDLPEDHVAALLANPVFWAFAALADDDVVGGLTAHALPMTSSRSSEMFIYDLAVRAERRRQGVGRALVAELRQQASEAGIDTVFVPADDEDEEAIEFYRAVGGTPSPVTFFTFGRPGGRGASR